MLDELSGDDNWAEYSQSHMQNKTNEIGYTNTNTEATLFLALWTVVRHLYIEARNTVKRLS
jgi:hypothetical protein